MFTAKSKDLMLPVLHHYAIVSDFLMDRHEHRLTPIWRSIFQFVIDDIKWRVSRKCSCQSCYKCPVVFVYGCQKLWESIDVCRTHGKGQSSTFYVVLAFSSTSK